MLPSTLLASRTKSQAADLMGEAKPFSERVLRRKRVFSSVGKTVDVLADLRRVIKIDDLHQARRDAWRRRASYCAGAALVCLLVPFFGGGGPVLFTGMMCGLLLSFLAYVFCNMVSGWSQKRDLPDGRLRIPDRIVEYALNQSGESVDAAAFVDFNNCYHKRYLTLKTGSWFAGVKRWWYFLRWLDVQCRRPDGTELSVVINRNMEISRSRDQHSFFFEEIHTEQIQVAISVPGLGAETRRAVADLVDNELGPELPVDRLSIQGNRFVLLLAPTVWENEQTRSCRSFEPAAPDDLTNHIDVMEAVRALDSGINDALSELGESFDDFLGDDEISIRSIGA